ncbi:MAG: putative pyridoxal kinase [Trizodia sp. TS-e1964]|nr:MAG: putative pyridoxal kinase [Trizodia sp. TS-e1964]
MVTFVLQSLGFEVAALNTVQFSNHSAYRQLKGTKTTAKEIQEIWEGLTQSYLTDFDMMLSGYIPGAEAVNEVGAIARELKSKASKVLGSFFWALDPVMGDEGRLYVNEDVIPAYKILLKDADLVLPNQFEAELLTGIKIDSLTALVSAMHILHKTYATPHVVITSVSIETSPRLLSTIGSTMKSDSSPRLFKIEFPRIDSFFSGTGDMFAALSLVRFREEVMYADLSQEQSWVSPDHVSATDLPLAKAVEKVIGSMQAVLKDTKRARDKTLEDMAEVLEKSSEKDRHLIKTKAAEMRLVRNVDKLKAPQVKYFAQVLEGASLQMK